jgi:O-antigen/teichoic acid export membrane protein
VTKRGTRGKHRGNRVDSPARNVAGKSLVRNSGFLIANLLLGAACGYGGVSLLARLYTVQAVGLSATAVSMSGLIVFITQFGVNYSLPRFLPISKDRTSLINTVFTVTIAASFLGAGIFLLLPVAGKLYALGGSLFAVTFVLATSVDTGEAVLETVMVADRASDKLARSNAIPNLIKLAAPPALRSAGSLGAYVARFVSDVVALAVFARGLRRKGHRFRPALDLEATRPIRRFSFGMYVASLLGSLPLLVLPIIILSRFGASASAYWSVAMSMAVLLFQLPCCPRWRSGPQSDVTCCRGRSC